MTKKKAAVAAHDNKDSSVEEIEKLQAQLEDLNNKYLRALADYQNLEKRMGGALEQARTQTRKDLLEKFLGVLDDLQKAEVFVKDNGLKMIMDNFASIFAQSGISELDVEGKEYDPYTSEALEVVETDDPEKDNIVLEVVQKGYALGDDIIRPARVKVSKITN